MKILVFSCDNNKDLWYPFYYCMEKYWRGHPEVIYKTERIRNHYYRTISRDYPLEKWSKGIREALKEIEDDFVLFIADDCFIRRNVDTKRVKEAEEFLKEHPKAGCVNFEKSFDDKDELCGDFKRRQKGSLYEVSLMCGLWRKEALIDILSEDNNPWDIELLNDSKDWDFYIGGDFIIDWGYETWHYAGVCKGKWCREAKYFFDNEGIEIDYDKRGFVDDNNSLL